MPALQGLDAKFEPTFMVLLQQTRLLVAGTAAWYPSSIRAQLGITMLKFAVLAYISLRLSPCLVQEVNLWSTVEFVVCTWLCIVSLVLSEGVRLFLFPFAASQMLLLLFFSH